MKICHLSATFAPESARRLCAGKRAFRNYWQGQPSCSPNPAKNLDQANKKVVSACFFDSPAATIELAAKKG
jgi:hypothetical protein